MAEITPYPAIDWPPPPTRCSAGEGEVHVWAATLRQPDERMSAFAQTLTADELARAARFHFDRDRNRFIAGRGLLRAILARHLKLEPARLRFEYSARGKPALPSLAGADGLQFNLAHSEDLAILAVTRICAIGVDVERLRPLSDADGIAERFFSPRESAGLKALPASQKPVGFFNLWTRKEAWLKATGEGIGESLNQVEVSLLPDEPARLISIFGDRQAAANWTLQELSPAPGFKAALACPATGIKFHCWSWRDDDETP